MANCEDVSTRMVELLYGELPADARSGVDAHVAGCARCRSELQGLERTRAVTRQALDESPPPRARAEILRRAAEHLAAQQPAAAAAAAAAPIVPASKTKKAAAPDQTGFWDWLRSRWTLPSLATVGAVALLVIGSRVLLEPANVDYKGSPELQREARQAAAPAASPPPAEIAPLPTPAAGESFAADKDTAAQPVKSAPATGSAPEGEVSGNGRGDLNPASASRRSRAKAEEKPKVAASATTSSGPVPAKKKLASADHPTDVDRFAPPPPPKPVTGFKMEGDDALSTSKPAAGGRRPSTSKADAEVAAGRPGGLGATSSLGGYGAGVGGGGKGAERLAAKEHAPREAPAPRMAEPAAAPAAPPPAAAMPPPAPTAPVRRESEKNEKKMKHAADEESAAAPEEGRGAGKSKAGAETAVARANRLFTEGRWAEAAAAYRELLRRDPNNAEAPRWRQRMAVAEAALESRRPSEPARAAPAQ